MTGTPTLPVLRWASAVANLHAHEGVGATAAGSGPVLASVAALAFGVAGAVWQALTTVVTAAEGGGAGAVAAPLDTLYSRVGGSLVTGSGLASVTIVAVLGGTVLAGWGAFRQGRGATGALRGLGGVLLPVAVLVVSVGAASRSPGAAGSPSWAVRAVSGWTTGLAGGLSRLADQVVPVPAAVPADPSGQAGCAAYVTGLEDEYGAAHSTGPAPSALQTGTAVELSRAWEGSVLAPWILAQFGDSPLADRTWCHLLEVQAGVPAVDQLAAMAADRTAGPGQPTWSQLVGTGSPAPPAATLLGPQFAGGDDDLDRVMVGWAACDYLGPGRGDDGWTVDPAFRAVGSPPPSDAARTCSTWWGQGTTEPPPKGTGTNATAGPFDFEDDGALVAATQAAAAAPTRAYVAALQGQGGGGRAIGPGLVAMTSSAAYAWSLGGPALGVLIAQLALVLLVALLPVILLLAAIPTPSTRRVAARAGALTAGALIASAGFTLLLSVQLGIMGLLQTVASGLLGGGAGAMPGLVQVLVPLATVTVLRRLLRRVALERTVSLTGSVRTVVEVARRGWNAVPAPADPLAPVAARPVIGRSIDRALPVPAPGVAVPRARQVAAVLDPPPRRPRPALPPPSPVPAIPGSTGRSTDRSPPALASPARLAPPTVGLRANALTPARALPSVPALPTPTDPDPA